MHDDSSSVEGRLGQVRRRLIRPNIWGDSVPLTVEAWTVPDSPDGTVGEPVPVDVALAADYQPAGPGYGWARPWGTTWLKVSGRVPDEWAGASVEAEIDLGFVGDNTGFQAEGMLWTELPDGTWGPRRGLHPMNHHVAVTGAGGAAGGEEVSYLVEAAANPPIMDWPPDPNSDRDTAADRPWYHLGQVRLRVVHPEVRALDEDITTLRGLMRQLPLDAVRRHDIVAALSAMLDRLDPLDVVGTAAAARAELAAVLASPAVPSAHRISAIGHAHIDSAWLWPVRETVRKCARTFSNVVRLMEDDPEVMFACSQAAQYEWMRDRYPNVFADIADRVAEGRWVPVGGMWVEADGNVSGGEALARQFLHGQRFFREHFGVTCTEVWIPDVFGYPASMPQLYRLAGCDRFLTQKMSWNATNVFPHHTFWWEGIDGSQVFTHFPPVDTYNASFRADELVGSVRRFREKGHATRSLMPFGYGDGGGGPNAKMLEQWHRVRDLEGMPRIEMESPRAFFDAAIAEYPDAPVWVGELYLEIHRGTYTSQARTKVGNRRSELLLREAELFAVLAGAGSPDAYPAAELDRTWKTVLFHQFHDILPGSSIGWVHREAEATYAEVAETLEGIIGTSLGGVAGAAGRAVVANAAPHDRVEVALVDATVASALGGGLDSAIDTGSARTQTLSDGLVAVRLAAPAMGIAPAVALEVDQPVAAGGRTLDNGVLRVEVADDGTLSSVIHLPSGREALAAGSRGALVQLHHDLPADYDAWDIDEYYRNRVEDLCGPCDIELIDAGPLVGRIRVRRRFRSSEITLTYELRAGSRRLDVACEIDWHERHHLLKLGFDLDVRTTDATREIQFGHLETPIHTNTTWDAARFEVCAHRWVDVGEPGFGVAILNDGRYGHDFTRRVARDGSASSTVARVSLLKGATFPDPRGDLGHHRVTVSLMPHDMPFRKAGVIAEGYRLNLPLRVVAPTSGSGPVADAGAVPAAPVAVDRPSVVVEAVKLAEDGSGDLVVRLYESYGARAEPEVRFGWPVDVVAVDLLEDEREDLPPCGLGVIDDTTVRLAMRPFQIVTLRARRR